MSAVVEHPFSHLVLSDCDCNAVLDCLDSGDAITDCSITASPLSALMLMTDLAGHHFLLQSSVTDLYTCLEHDSAHKSASTSACIVLPKQPGVWRKYLRHAQLLKDLPRSDACFAPSDREHELCKCSISMLCKCTMTHLL